jgi:alpha-tubulin suppressor-like RCC1 family protein
MAAEKPVMQMQVGGSHTVAATGRGILFAWGWNDNGQCAQDVDLFDEVVVRNSSQEAFVELPLSQNAVATEKQVYDSTTGKVTNKLI